MFVIREGNAFIYVLIVLIGLFVFFNVKSKKEQALKFVPVLEQELQALRMPDGANLIAVERITKASAGVYVIYDLGWYEKKEDVAKIKSHFSKTLKDNGWNFHSESNFNDNAYYEEWLASWYKGELALDVKIFHKDKKESFMISINWFAY